MAKNLWLTKPTIAMVRRQLAAGEPTACGILERCMEAAAAPEPRVGTGPAEGIVAHAVAHAITHEAHYARSACDALLAWSSPSQGSVERASFVLHGAIAQDCCAEAWDEARRRAVVERLHRLQLGFFTEEFSRGDPYDGTDHARLVAHVGAALAAMAAHARVGEAGTRKLDLDDALARAAGRVRAFLYRHGDQGLSHEGLVRQLEAAAYWLPFLYAYRHVCGVDLLRELPHLRNMGIALYACVAARASRPGPSGPDSERAVGMSLAWRGDDGVWCRANPAVLLAAIAPAAQRGGLRWMYDNLSGVKGDRRFAPDMGGWFFALLHYPYDGPAVEPDTVLPHHLIDTRQGLMIHRPRYRAADDTILGVHARTTIGGGAVPADAGSIRFMSLGHDWIRGCGRHRGEAIYQSVVCPADVDEPAPSHARGVVTWDESDRNGCVFGLDRRAIWGCPAERWIALRHDLDDIEVAIALLDLVDDQRGRTWFWNMSFEPGLTVALHDDGAGFTLSDDVGVSLQALFLAARPRSLKALREPDSRRADASPADSALSTGGPYLQAEFAAAPRLRIFVGMTVQRGAAPVMDRAAGLDLVIGKTVWRRPFGPALPGRAGGSSSER